MSLLKRFVLHPICTDAFYEKLAEMAMYVGAILVLVFGVKAAERFGLGGGEMLQAVLGVCNLAMMCIVLGVLVGRDRK